MPGDSVRNREITQDEENIPPTSKAHNPVWSTGFLGTMVLLLGINFAESRLVKRALETFYGIGPAVSQRIMSKLYIHPTAKMGNLEQRKVLDLVSELSTMKIENELRRELRDNIARLRDMGSYRGRRHAMGLPVRGQRTRSQIQTARKLNRVERIG